MIKDEIKIEGYLDNAKSKHGQYINGYYCTPFEEVQLKEDQGIIVTISQIARTSAVEDLIERGSVKNKDFFIIEDFLSVYYVYKYNKVYFTNVSFLPSTACNLNCKNCLNFNPFAKQFYVREFEDLKKTYLGIIGARHYKV